MNEFSISRVELYDLVWSVPGWKLARRFGISDVGLAKACRKYKIPRPPRGYWQKHRFGKRVRRVRLPKLTEDSSWMATVTLGSHAKAAAHESQEIRERKAYERDPTHRIEVSDELTRPHCLLRPRRGQAPTVRSVLRERLCRKCYARSLRIMDALFKAPTSEVSQSKREMVIGHRHWPTSP